MKSIAEAAALWLGVVLAGAAPAGGGEDWVQFKYDERHSGDAGGRAVTPPLGLLGAVPLSDAVLSAPAVKGGRVYVVDASGTAFCIDAASLKVLWKFTSRGGAANCSNVSSPAIAGKYLHFGTMAGSYYVLDAAGGDLVKEIRCGDPVMGSPVVANDGVYFVTLGARAHAVTAAGEVRWTWDYVKQVLGFDGDRWSGQDWLKHKKGDRATAEDKFCVSTEPAVYKKSLVFHAGGRTVWLEDLGDRPRMRGMHVPFPRQFPGRYLPGPDCFGLSIGEEGDVYVQYHMEDYGGALCVLHDGRVETDYVRGIRELDVVPGTGTSASSSDMRSFSCVSLRGKEVYRCRPQEGLGLCRHTGKGTAYQKKGAGKVDRLGDSPSFSSPILLRDSAVYGGLDGSLHVAPLAGDGKPWSFRTAFGKPIPAPVAVCDGRIYFGCEDGYLYVLGPDGNAPLPTKDLGLWKIRSPLAGKYADGRYDWYTSFADFANTDAVDQKISPPFRMKWVRRFQGTAGPHSTHGGGRMYTHTVEGQVFAVEQETGRLLWRTYWPGTFKSYTSPLYHSERVIVPQAGLKDGRLRCLDAATGKELWQAPISGSPSFTRETPPVVHKGLVIYMFAAGTYEAGHWLFHRPQYGDHKPLVRAWLLATGKEVWTRDFSEFGAGGDLASLCLMGETLYYTCYFGQEADTGVTAAMDPETGKVLWSTKEYFARRGCALSGKDGRLYLGGYMADKKTGKRYLRCLDATDGKLIWETVIAGSVPRVVTIGTSFLHFHSQKGRSHLIDKASGKVLSTFADKWHCVKFPLAEPYLLGVDMSIYDTSGGNRLVSTGPAMSHKECSGTVVSNGRIFYTAHGGGLQASQVCGPEAAGFTPPWEGGTEKTP